MKKVMKVCMAGVVSISMLGACSFGKKERRTKECRFIDWEIIKRNSKST